MAAPRPLFAVEVPEHGPALVAGIPLPDTMVEQLRASASIEPLLVDEHGAATAVGKRASSLSPKIARAVLRRDGHCRCGQCDLRYGLQVHHLRPRSWGGTDEISNLAAVASVHHPMLIPNGPYALVGNPNQPDGLRMVHLDDLTPDEAKQVGLPPRRAGPNAA
jgi:HNH endonuclease